MMVSKRWVVARSKTSRRSNIAGGPRCAHGESRLSRLGPRHGADARRHRGVDRGDGEAARWPARQPHRCQPRPRQRPHPRRARHDGACVSAADEDQIAGDGSGGAHGRRVDAGGSLGKRGVDAPSKEHRAIARRCRLEPEDAWPPNTTGMDPAGGACSGPVSARPCCRSHPRPPARLRRARPAGSISSSPSTAPTGASPPTCAPTLLDALREHLDLTGAKKGCDHGQCGACTVHVGRAPRALLPDPGGAPPRAAQITTIEGLAGADGAAAPDAAGLHRPRRLPVRLLHAGPDHVGGRLRRTRATPARRPRSANT